MNTKKYLCFGNPTEVDPAKCAECPKAIACVAHAEYCEKIRRRQDRKNRERLALSISKRGYPIKSCREYVALRD